MPEGALQKADQLGAIVRAVKIAEGFLPLLDGNPPLLRFVSPMLPQGPLKGGGMDIAAKIADIMGNDPQPQAPPSGQGFAPVDPLAAEPADHPLHHQAGGLLLMQMKKALMGAVWIHIAESEPPGIDTDGQPPFAPLPDLLRKTAVNSIFQWVSTSYIWSRR